MNNCNQAINSLWSKTPEQLYVQFSTSADGLTPQEALLRLKKHGRNAIPDKDRKVWFDILIAQFQSPLLLILIFASVVAVFVGEITDTYIMILIILATVMLGFVQEYKSERTLTALRKYFRYHATVIRNGERMQIDSSELVPGEIVTVGLGDIVPADLRLIETHGIIVNDGILTGESKGIEKTMAVPLNTETPQQIINGLFMGTTVTSGYAKGIVVATGAQTFFGRTAAIFSSKVPESDFQIELRKFGNSLIRVILVLTLFVFIINYILGHGSNPLTDSALFALALAIGIAPEALPAIVTITLSNGSMHLAKKKVITKKLAAIEDLGNIDVLCTDKTGTLTEGEEKAERFIGLDGTENELVLRYGFLCNSAVGSVKVRGNPIDVAIRKYGLVHKLNVSGYHRTAELPFDFTRRRMGVVIKEGNTSILIVKGAPESVLSVCNNIKINSKSYPIAKKEKEVRNLFVNYNKEGYTTIALACKELKGRLNDDFDNSEESDLTLIGLILLSNPPKATVYETVERLKKLNIKLKIVTGDDAKVTQRLCESVGLGAAAKNIIIGSELAQMSEGAVAEVVEKADVFARVTPEQKLLIVETLRKNGHVVGFLGDGINDAPALRAADVGISVDSAADVAKGASHIILLKKSLHVICDGVEEGRKIFGNITKYILNTMSANQGNMITVALSSIFLPFIPLLPSQILLNNLLSDVPNLSISSDNVDNEYRKKPQKWDMGFIFMFMVFFGTISTVFDLLFISVLYWFVNVDLDTFRTAWFLESVLSEMIILFSLRTRLPFFRNMPSMLLTVVSVGAMVLATAVIYFFLLPLSSISCRLDYLSLC